MNLGKGDVGQILFRSFLKSPTSLERGRYSNHCLEVVTDTEKAVGDNATKDRLLPSLHWEESCTKQRLLCGRIP